MKNAATAWMWSLGVVARSYRLVALLAVVTALWAFAAYGWLGMPAESSMPLMGLSIIWAIAQLGVAVFIVGGAIAAAVQVSATKDNAVSISSVWALGRKRFGTALVFCSITVVIVGICGWLFGWINGRAIDVASFLTFHRQKPVAEETIVNVYQVIDFLLWAVIGGFLLSGWIERARSSVKHQGRWSRLLIQCAFQTPFLTTVLSAIVWGSVAYQLAHEHPTVSPGFWDYTQVITRIALATVVATAGVLFWVLSLTRLNELRGQESAASGKS